MNNARKIVQWLGAIVFLAVAIPLYDRPNLTNLAIAAGTLLAIIVALAIIPKPPEDQQEP